MRADDGGVTVADALREARATAFPPGEFVGQESFVSASEVLSLAGRAGVTSGTRLLDLCCGEAGPGLHLTRVLGCTYLGVDADPRSVARARERADADGVPARVELVRVPPVPPGPFDVVLLLETMLAFRDKRALLAGISSALAPGGRFAFTLEEGLPLTGAERELMPGSDTVWLTSLPRLRSELGRAGLRVRWCVETSRAHRLTVDALVGSYVAVAPRLRGTCATGEVAGLVASHLVWSRWLRQGRVRTFAVVAQKL